jgi:FkbM family methyltransferase
MKNFSSRYEARCSAVEAPDDVNALAGGYWPPYSRQEMMKIPAILRRIVVLGSATGEMPDYVLSPRVLLWRLQELAKVFKERLQRHASPQSWSQTLSNGQTIRLPLSDPSAAAFKEMADKFEPHYEKTLADFLIRTLKPGDIFVDGGANVGYISAVAATTGAVVFAIEIQRELISQIEAVATLNDFDLIRPLHLGLSSSTGLTSMWRTGINFGAALEGRTDRAHDDEPGSIADDFVPVIALDDLFDGRTLRPAVVKIDVEGHEIEVLSGARRLISERNTIFVVEYHSHLIQLFGRTGRDLIALFDLDQWDMHQLTDDGLVRIRAVEELTADARDPNPKIVFAPRQG